MELPEGKYIVFKDGTAEVFDYNNIHKWVAAGRPVSSAGFFKIVDGKVVCYGESDSLRVRSKPGDEDYVAEALEY